MSNRIKSCKYIAIRVKVASPICVSSGVADYTDSDVMRNGDGDVFIPGTSLTGAFRNYTERKKNEESIFGYSKGEDGHMSSVFVSDLYFDSGVRISERDQVQLNKDKQVNNKFDTEILETGAEGIIYLHYIVREKDNSEAEFDSEIMDIIKAIKKGYIRIGSNRNRGFGRLEILETRSKRFTSEQRESMLEFKSNDYKNIEKYDTEISHEDMSSDENDLDKSKFIKICVPLRLTGGISIRKYSTEPKKADYEHITCNGKPVIPGSSWNGAIRAMCLRILEDILDDSDKASKYIDDWFGFVNIGAKESELKARQSAIVFNESVLDGGEEKILSRNKVNRFDGSTIDGALYTEKSYFGGTTVLEIMLRKSNSNYKALAGLIQLVIEDIKEGYISIGGQAAIGRGIFEANNEENAKIEWQGAKEGEEFGKELFKLLEPNMRKEGM